MCTVFAYGGRRLDEAGVLSRLELTHRRGPDGQCVTRMPDGGLMAFQRLSIMGLDESGMQPFCYKDWYSVTNGELYGFRRTKEDLMRRGHVFHSGSDCELVLHLYEEEGVDMFKALDAEFASVIWDPRAGFIAARDPIGIRPLFYGHDADGAPAFASEARLLMGLCDDIKPFPPGTYYRDGVFTTYCDLTKQEVRHVSEEEAARGIRTRLVKAVEKRLDSDAPLGFLLSGGLDSSLVCAIAAKRLSKPIRTFAIGMEEDAIDARYARQVASYIHSEHTEVLMTMDEVLSALEEVICCLASYDITTIRASLGMYLLCRYISRETDVRVLLTGEVSDELFGYKYTDYAPSPEAFQEESRKRVRELHCYDVLRADRCIADNSIEARVPFGDLDFASYVLSLDPSIKMNRHGKGKWLLRQAFKDGGWLPESILMREKAAFSDAVGHSMVDNIKAHAAKLYKGTAWQEECLKYPVQGRPYTPESLLYRTIFECHYPGQAGMIPGFWMPNRSWEGCDVDDPSARVLANYGASGS